jgi:hypothetical protein
MASPEEIALVKTQIPEESDAYGFDDEAIGAMLDAGLSTTEVILAVWSGISAKTSSMVDVSESGSSRSLSQISSNARAMADWWKLKKEAEDAAAAGPDKAKTGRIAFHTATRV